MVKANRNGQAATLSTEQLVALANELSPAPRAVFSLCRFTAARVNEALSLKWENLTQAEVVIPKMVTKKKMRTRCVPMTPKLWQAISDWKDAWRAARGWRWRKTGQQLQRHRQPVLTKTDHNRPPQQGGSERDNRRLHS